MTPSLSSLVLSSINCILSIDISYKVDQQIQSTSFILQMHEQQQPTEHCTNHITQKAVAICLSPLCDHYRLLCQQCVLTDKKHRTTMHKSFDYASEQAFNIAQKTSKGLRALKTRIRQQVQVNIRNNPGLEEIEKKLYEIREMINQKIDDFIGKIKKIYTKSVREKLDQLEQIIQESQKSINQQLEQLGQKCNKHLKVFFKNDFLHELKYFESHFNEIFVKKIRNFRTSIESDKVLTLMVNFQQNLQRIFNITKEPKINNKQEKNHLFFCREVAKKTECLIYEGYPKKLILEHRPIGNFDEINRFFHLPGYQNEIYKWQGIPQSIYYPQNACYYIIGEGERQSKKIVKYQQNKQTQDNFKLVKIMQTLRKNFSVCQLNGQIYIIGGQNQKQGCLVKCEKFVPTYNNQIYIVKSLNQKSSRHAVSTYKNKYILKFGGINRLVDKNISLREKEYLDQKIYCYPEIYSVETQQWSVIQFKKSEQADVKFKCSPSIFSYQQKNYILILGGEDYFSEQSLNQREQNFWKSTHRVYIQMSAHDEIEQVKIKKYNQGLEAKYEIINVSILRNSQGFCTFFRRDKFNNNFSFGKLS